MLYSISRVIRPQSFYILFRVLRIDPRQATASRPLCPVVYDPLQLRMRPPKLEICSLGVFLVIRFVSNHVEVVLR